MRTSAALLSGLALVGFFAPAASRADELKLSYVDLQRALNEIEEGRSAKDQLKKEFEQKQGLLNDKQEELKRLKADLDKQSAVLSDTAKRDRQSELDQKFFQVQQLFVQLQKELSEREREMTRGIFDKMNGIIREIAEADHLTMVFEKTDAGLLYAPASYDLTNELIRKYNARYKGGGAAAAAAKKPAKTDKTK